MKVSRIVPWFVIAMIAAPASASAQGGEDDEVSDYDVDGYSRDPDNADFTPYSPFYTGAFLAMGAFAGPTLLSGDGIEAATSVAYGGWVQASSPLQVLDFRLTYYGSSHENPTSAGETVKIRQDTLLLSGGGHPFFLAHLENSRFFYALGSLYLLLGVDVELVQAEINGEELSEVDFGVQLGGGFDIAIDDVDDGGAFWIGVQYLYNQWDFDKDPLRDIDIGQHLLFITLGYRNNGVIVPI